MSQIEKGADPLPMRIQVPKGAGVCLQSRLGIGVRSLVCKVKFEDL